METTGDFFALGPAHDRIRQDQNLKHLHIKLFKGERIYFGGYGLICVTEGHLSVLGARIGPENGSLPFHSPKSNSLMYVSACFEDERVEFYISELMNGPIVLEEGDPSPSSTFIFPVRYFRLNIVGLTCSAPCPLVYLMSSL